MWHNFLTELFHCMFDYVSDVAGRLLPCQVTTLYRLSGFSAELISEQVDLSSKQINIDCLVVLKHIILVMKSSPYTAQTSREVLAAL